MIGRSHSTAPLLRERYVASLLVVLASVIGLTGSAGAELREGGFIETFAGEASEYRIYRGRTRVTPAPFAPLYVGDRLEVLTEAGRLDIRLSDGTSQALTRKNGLLVVPASRSTDVSDNLLRLARDWLDGSDSSDAQENVSLTSRSPVARLRAPLLEAPGPKLRSGTERIHLSWLGGEPPFSVRVWIPGEAESSRRDGIPERHLSIDTPGLHPGLARLWISDARDQRIESGLQVMELPAELDTQEPSMRAIELQRTLDAVRIAGFEDGSWRFEAYQRLFSIEADYLPARQLREALETRSRP